MTLFGLASSCLHPCPFCSRLTPKESCPRSKCPCFKHVHATNKESSQQTSKEDNKEVKRAKRGKQNAKHTKGQTNMLSNKKGCPKMTNLGLNQVSIVPLNWSTDDTCAIKQNSYKGLGVSCIKEGCELTWDSKN